MTTDQIDALLPQTQCGLCEYDGCKPYAEAIAHDGEVINRCLPGGVATLRELAQLTDQDPTSMIPEMEEKQKLASIAIIREDSCIGCTKCIQSCPTDAIVGAAKLMHTIITEDCTGCELCIPVCPVDCIDMLTIPEPNQQQKQERAHHFREKYNKRNHRLSQNSEKEKQQHQQAKLHNNEQSKTLAARKNAIAEAVARAKAKKAQKVTYSNQG